MTAPYQARCALAIYAGILGLVAALALLLLALGSSEARALLPLGFGHLPRNAGTAATIAVNNARVALVPLGFAALGGRRVVIRRVGDLVVGGQLAVNAALLAAALAGYGMRAVMALLPHTPVELAAYAIGGAVYLRGRREPLGPRSLALPAAACALLLALAAALETYVQLRVGG